MANQVYTTIFFTEELTQLQEEKLNEIIKVGVCKYYRPMPEGLKSIVCSNNIAKLRKHFIENDGVINDDYMSNNKITEDDIEMVKESIRLYGETGHYDWYDWALDNWGTKWGDYDMNYNNNTFTFLSAWSPVYMDIIRDFAKDFPNFTYEWEEEQGFGELYEYKSGDEIFIEEWDAPEFEETENPDIYYLTKPYRSCEIGYYYECNANEDVFLGYTFEEALENINN